MSAAAKHTALAALTVLALAVLAIAVPSGGASPDRDREPPTTPVNLQVTAASSTLVSVKWDPSSDDVGVEGYYVFGDKGQGKETVEKPEYVVSGLRCGDSTVLSVVAFDGAQNRSEKATLAVATAPCPDTQPPSAPTGFTQLATTRDAVVLGWTPSTDNVGVVQYGVYRGLERVAATTEPNVTLSGLSCASTYSYLVEAVDAAGNRSPQVSTYVRTADCVVGDSTPPSTPTGLATSGVTLTGLSLSWNASTDNIGVAGYDVYRDGARIASPTTTSVSQSGLTCGTTYTLEVAARDAAGNLSPRAKRSASTSSCLSSPPSGDTTPPSAPTGLVASSITETSLSLSWNSSTDNVGVAGYDIYRNGVKVASPATTGAGQSGLACGTTYSFEVAARDGAGNVSQRAQLSVATASCSSVADTTPPSAPSGLVVSAATDTSVSLRWNPSTDNVAVTGYRVYLATSVTPTTQTNVTVTGLACGSAYMFAIAAVDAQGNLSARASVTGSTAACADVDAPSAPSNVVASSRTASSIALNWSASSDDVGVVGYGLYRAGVQVGTADSTTGIFSGLACNTNYTLGVDATDAAGNRSPKTTVMVSTTACPDTQAPSAPTGLSAANVTQTSLTLTWSASSDNVGVTGYDVLRGGTKIAIVTGGTSINIVSLACGTAYAFAVIANDAAGNSSNPAQTNASTSACPASASSVASYYVDPSGSDSGTGSATSPWKTLAKACASVPANIGATIVMRPGTYVESSTCNLPPKTNLQGAGGRNGATTLKGTADPLVSLVNASGSTNVQTVSGLKLDGQSRTAGTRGMKVDNVRGLTIRDILADGFKGADAGGGLDVNHVWNADVGDSTFRNSAGIFSNFVGGSLGVRNAFDSVFHDIDASDDRGFAVKGGWTGDTLSNVEFYNLRCTVGSQLNALNSGQPNIAFEMNEMDVTNVTIRNSYFNATLSLTNQQLGVVLPTGQWHYDIHNNLFEMPSSPSYALELDQHSSEVHHNYFRGGVHPIANFEPDAKSGDSIHHNVFDGQENWVALMYFRGGLRDSEFFKNTFVGRQGSWNSLINLNETLATSNPNIRDNIFMSIPPLGDVFGGGLGSATINHNVFYNVPSRGTNSLASNPSLPLAGGFPAAFVPASGTPAAAYGAFADGVWSGVGPS